jgi:phospholipid/cholesterol/gamma-HCH transport system ATP-binding protein
MIYFKDIYKRFGKREILRGVDLHIVKGKTTVVFGVSGSGKSTMIKHIVGLLAPDKGEIIVDGEQIIGCSEEKMRAIRKEVGFLFQSGALFDSMNVYENIAFPLREHTKMSEEDIHKNVFSKLAMVGLKAEEIFMLFPDELSGGMRKRVGLARTIVLEPKVILYDEPTSGLDPVTSDHITQMIIKLQHELKVTSVLISHDIQESFKAGDYFAMLLEGKIIAYGNEEEIRNSTHPAVQQFLHGKSEGPIQFV